MQLGTYILTAALLASAMGIAAPSQSAANGYVDSRVCADCHAQISETYRRSGMARSFYRPGPEIMPEDFRASNEYYHQPSDTHFQMIQRGGHYFQRRYQIGFDGKETNLDEKEIDYVLGSGNHVRTYLHRTGAGALLQLPLAWYAEKGGYWAMNPGYDRPDQPNARRKIDYECMFCHNAYPEIPSGHDQLRAEPLFAPELPEGIGCQRCHGPGRLHVQLARRPGTAAQDIRNAIVNPARLNPERRAEICMQCHLETTSFPFPHSIANFGRGPFSYRPGQPLADFELFFDHPDPPTEDRFQIASSVYRLRLSQCFLKSGGALECTTCHNPHEVARGEEAVRRYDEVCTGCHTAAFRAAVESGRHTRAGDCVGCHMPKRRTADVVHAVMTDHYIRRTPPAGDPLAAKIEPHEPEILYRGEVRPYYPEKLAPSPENILYLALAQVRDNNNTDRGLVQLNAALKKYRPQQSEFYIGLGDASLARGESSQAASAYEQAARLKPDSLAAWLGLGNAFEQAGKLDRAADAFRRAAQLYPDNAEAWRKLGEVCVKEGRDQEALAALQKSAQLDPDIPETQYALGTLWSKPPADTGRAEKGFREAIRLEPDYAQAHMNLAILLFSRRQIDEATYHFAYAVRVRPRYALGHFNYALMLTKLQRLQEARAEFQATLAADPNYAQAHEELGNLAELNGRADDAGREYAEAVRLRPDLARSQLGLGAALARQGRVDEARRHLSLAAASPDPAIQDGAQRLLKQLARP
ncbi:MAG TPA: tetratricopeptide repeat protein [Bryobacteraceae bacterium]|nr:tetratricopeptide repeat protein [Bryobacteraceae bacterium]